MAVVKISSEPQDGNTGDKGDERVSASKQEVTCQQMAVQAATEAAQAAATYWSNTWGLLQPKRAPEWFRRRVLGTGSGDVHLQPAPKGSLGLLGFIAFDVPSEDVARLYYHKGIGAGEAVTSTPGEVRFNVGPTQIIHRVVPDAPAQRLPGIATIWLEDIRVVTDGFHLLGPELDRNLVAEIYEALTGGEFSMLVKGPFRTNMYVVTEAPDDGRLADLRSLPRHKNKEDLEDPPVKTNVLAMIDLTFPVPSRAAMVSCMKFYEQYLGVHGITGGGPTQYHCSIHFGPSNSLNQTLTFKQDETPVSWTNSGSVGMYFGSAHAFVIAFAKCKQGNLLANPNLDVKSAIAAKEFSITGIKDPETGAVVMPLKHILRHPEHPECPLQLGSEEVKTKPSS